MRSLARGVGMLSAKLPSHDYLTKRKGLYLEPRQSINEVVSKRPSLQSVFHVFNGRDGHVSVIFLSPRYKIAEMDDSSVSQSRGIGFIEHMSPMAILYLNRSPLRADFDKQLRTYLYESTKQRREPSAFHVRIKSKPIGFHLTTNTHYKSG